MGETISYEEFQRLAEKLVKKSDLLKDGWTLNNWSSAAGLKGHDEARVYLVKKCTQRLQTAIEHGKADKNDFEDAQEEKKLSELAGDVSGLEDEDDPASLGSRDEHILDKSSGGGEGTWVCLEYHVVHSVSYQVPILYFNASYTNGRPLPLNDIWRLLSLRFVSTDANKWGLLTQQEHPYLGQPFYHIHPCHSAEVMDKALQCSLALEGQGRGNYLITWLSTFALLVGLELPIEYGES